MSPVTGTWGRMQLQLSCEDPDHSKIIFRERMQGLYHIWELGHGLQPQETKNQHLQNHHRTVCLKSTGQFEDLLDGGWSSTGHLRCSRALELRAERSRHQSAQITQKGFPSKLKNYEFNNLAFTSRLNFNFLWWYTCCLGIIFLWPCPCFPKSDSFGWPSCPPS